MARKSKALARVESTTALTKAGMSTMGDLHRYAHDKASYALGEASRVLESTSDPGARSRIMGHTRSYEREMLNILDRAGNNIAGRIERGR